MPSILVLNLISKTDEIGCLLFRQSREEHDAHVAALGKEDAEMEEVGPDDDLQ